MSRRTRTPWPRWALTFSGAVVESRYAWAGRVGAKAVTKPRRAAPTLTDALDRVLMHPLWGYVIFFGVMAFVFQTIFTWAQIPMDWIGHRASAPYRRLITAHMPAGDLQDLLVNGIIAGVGTTITFLPQILLLFFAIALLEDTGYMARAAFPHGQDHVQSGPARQVVHPPAVVVRLRHSGHHGDAHH